MSGNAGKEAVRAFIDAFNKLDSEAMADALNFAHIRFVGGQFVVFESRGDFVRRQDATKSAREAEGWHHSVIESLAVIHEAPDKVHLATEFTQRRADESVYGRFYSLWIATLQDGHWGIQFRSSCIPPDLAQVQ